jgi:hypothetical protein
MYINGLIRVLGRLVQLCPIEMLVAVSILSSHLMSPQVVHLEQCFHLFVCFNTHKNSRLIFTATYHNIAHAHFTDSD